MAGCVVRVSCLFLVTGLLVFSPLNVDAASSIAHVGERVVLKCHTNLSYGVVWSYKTSLVDKTNKDIVLYGEVINGNVKYFELSQPEIGDYNLVIRNATSNNSGLYQCIEDDGLGQVHDTLLTVMHNQVVVSGQRVSLKCPDDDVTANVVWSYRANLSDQNHRDIYLDGEVINGNKKRIEIDISSPGDLIIASVAISDTGIYTCTENDGQGFSHHTYVNVLSSDVTSSSTHESTQQWQITTQLPKEPARPVLCEAGTFFNELGNDCIACDEICGSRGRLELCRIYCRELVWTSDEPSPALPYVSLVLISTCASVISVIIIGLIAVVVWLLCRKRRATRRQLELDRRQAVSALPSLVPFISEDATSAAHAEYVESGAEDNVRFSIGRKYVAVMEDPLTDPTIQITKT